ncbi:thiol:disulfide interchange protein [Defluviimonas sp. 20V17]|uniref:Thiol-disulfide isomerase or thioredoxin n=1 Tax=Allgaiera indica TaxID=765699 RepID=A0AAN4USU9_9RHOB|nr:TlpA disulfide reductase family protein [Allgaiera indica]KDB04627.1 thiol:disulfide interchange protein [Defluviimonas sp. 20V17]GHE03708.1 thiol:disulfide interchange protein [Allgaiera indica]SDX74113.1 Thiol-disulfide isomerase or thioredoxin [Allgaiera indica]
MTGISLGPFVLAGGRLAALIALAAFLLAIEGIGWWRRRRGTGGADGFGRWPTLVVLGWILGARAGYVVANWPAFAAAPADIVKLWQGGFSTQTGLTAAILTIAAAAFLRPRALLPLAVSAAVAGLASGATMLVLSAPQPVTATTLAPGPFAALDGHSAPLADPPGRPVVVNLWASWCGPCRREMPMLQQIAAQTPGVEFRFVNQGESPATIQRFLTQEHLSGADVRLDPRRSLMVRYLSLGLPATLFFRADGTLVQGSIGEISRAETLRQIRILETAANND